MQIDKNLNKSEELNYFFNLNNIEWKFNVSITPWWARQFENIVNRVKNALNKTVGKVTL